MMNQNGQIGALARRGGRRLALSITASALALCIAQPSWAQQSSDDNTVVDTIVVQGTSSRISDDLSSVPGTVTIVDSETLAEQSLFSNDLGDILARNVPGFGVSSAGSFSNFSQTLRGRKPAVFIDGVPTTVPLRDGGRDLRLISPGAIGQVEVISGSTAIYGLGGAGGLINFATKEPINDGAEFQTDVSLGLSLVDTDDSLNYTVQQAGSGRSGPVSFVFSGFYENYGSFYDANGNLIPPDPQGQGGIADSDSYNIFSKVGFDFTDTQSVFLSVNYYETEQDTDLVASPGVFGERPAVAVEGTPIGDNQSTSNLVASARYVNEDIFGSTLNIQGFYSDYEAVFSFNEAPVFPPDGGQSLIAAERYGVRLDINTPFNLGGGDGNLLWGLDYTEDETSQPLTDGRLLVPLLKQTSISPFAQIQYAATDWLDIVGGIRFENAEISVDTFTTIPIFEPSLPGGETIEGGTVDYSEVLFNIGAVVSPFKGALEGVDLYGGFSQGFTVNDFGRALRSATTPSVEDFDFEAQVIDSYEVGVRSQMGNVTSSLAAFYSESEFGSSFNSTTLELIRAPEKVWGIEATVDVEPTDDWRFGGALAWVDGETEDVTTGDTSRLDTSRISPTKLTGYVEHDISENWATRAQLTHSSRQQRFNNQIEFGRTDVEAFTLVDVSVTGKVGPGHATLAINNLLNETYFTPDAFRFASDIDFTSGPGATARVTYSIKY